jgi:hypothetical protein
MRRIHRSFAVVLNEISTPNRAFQPSAIPEVSFVHGFRKRTLRKRREPWVQVCLARFMAISP